MKINDDVHNNIQKANTMNERHKMELLSEIVKLRSKESDKEWQELCSAVFTFVANSNNSVTPENFIKALFKANQVKVDPTGIFINGDPVRNVKAFTHQIYQSWRDYRKRAGLKVNITKDDITYGLEWILEQDWQDKQEALRRDLAPAEDFSTFDRLLRSLARAICGRKYPDENSIEFRRALGFLAHFIWTTQMHLHYGARSTLQSGHEAVLMLISRKQKTGKSSTVRYMVEPFTKHDFVWKTDFARLEDTFSMHNLAYSYITWFDDAARSTVKNMEKFKQVITDEQVHFRVMHSQQEKRIDKLTSFIATSNKAARDLMNDTTGLRRFHQIFVNDGSVVQGEGIDLDALSKFPFADLYRSVPLTSESVMFRYITPLELEAYEQEIRPEHTVERWMKDMNFALALDEDEGELMSYSDLYQSFRAWALENGYMPQYICNSSSFTNTMMALGALRGRTNSYRGFRIVKENK